MCKVRICNIINLTVRELLSLTVVKVLNRTIVAGDTAVNLCVLAALGANILLACVIAVVLTYGICR